MDGHDGQTTETADRRACTVAVAAMGLSRSGLGRCGPPRRGARLAPTLARRLGDPRASHIRRRDRGADRGLVARVRAGRPPGVAGGGRAGIGRGRRMGRAANAHDGEGRSLRCRGRCVSDPDPQRVCRPLGRRLGARDRRRALRVPRRRVGAAVDRRTAAPALLAQGRRRDTGDCADRRGHAHPVARRGHGRARRGPDPALGVLRPRRLVAVGQPARHAATTADG